MATRRRSEQRRTIILVQVSASGHVTSHLVPAVMPSTATQMQLLHVCISINLHLVLIETFNDY